MFNLIPWKQKRQTDAGRSLMAQPFERSLTKLRDDFDSLVSRFWDDWPLGGKGWLQNQVGWSFDMEERDDAYVVRAEAPGFEADDFNIDVRGNYLSIRAEHKEEQENGDRGSSYHYGRFERTTTLPFGVDTENISARYRSGVLELRLPKKEEARGKRITVQAS
jgi:HSP20 family protein